MNSRRCHVLNATRSESPSELSLVRRKLKTWNETKGHFTRVRARIRNIVKEHGSLNKLTEKEKEEKRTGKRRARLDKGFRGRDAGPHPLVAKSFRASGTTGHAMAAERF